jgi:transketolase
MPNMLIAAPGDPMEVRACMRYLVANPQPSYLRLGKAGEPNFHVEVPAVEPGQWLKVAAGEIEPGATLLCTGATLGIAMERRHQWLAPRCGVHSIPLWGMSMKSVQPKQVDRHTEVTTLEDHLMDGGFGSWLLESVAARRDLLRRLNVQALDPRVCGTVGSQGTLNAWGGLQP